MLSRWSALAAVLAVLAAYVYFGSGETWGFRRVTWERAEGLSFTERYYAAQAEGFLRGQTHLPYAPDARWQQVPNAYDFASRATHDLAWEMWDASLYRGKFYLYFSPVPVVLFYVPFKVLLRGYPPDALAAVFFAAWAFVACVLFARRALPVTRVPFAIWVLLIGLGNVVPFALKSVRAYEVAVTAGMAMTASFAYALLRWTESHETRHAVWMGVWLALAIATRPNLAVLLLVFAFVLFVAKKKRALVAVIPLAIVAIALGAYNHARFGNPLELGMTYQISYEPMWRAAPCSLTDCTEAIRFVNNVVHYVFWGPHFRSESPHVVLQANVLERGISFAGGAEAIGGVAALNPLTFLASAIAVVFALRRNARPSGALRVMFAAWLILAGLATCRWVTARYALDFMMLMTTASAVCIEEALALLVDVRTRLVAAFVSILALYSIVTGVLLGLK